MSEGWLERAVDGWLRDELERYTTHVEAQRYSHPERRIGHVEDFLAFLRGEPRKSGERRQGGDGD